MIDEPGTASDVSAEDALELEREFTERSFVEQGFGTEGPDADEESRVPNAYLELGFALGSRGTLVSALDVADYILQKCGKMSTMKLQKLAYYSQAWSLVWDEKTLFCEDIEAWANGPVIRELFDFHRGSFDIERVRTGNPSLLSQQQRETIDAVLDFYGDKSAQWLIWLSHSEPPWQRARAGLQPTERGCRKISPESMADYYSSLLSD